MAFPRLRINWFLLGLPILMDMDKTHSLRPAVHQLRTLLEVHLLEVPRVRQVTLTRTAQVGPIVTQWAPAECPGHLHTLGCPGCLECLECLLLAHLVMK